MGRKVLISSREEINPFSRLVLSHDHITGTSYIFALNDILNILKSSGLQYFFFLLSAEIKINCNKKKCTLLLLLSKE